MSIEIAYDDEKARAKWEEEARAKWEEHRNDPDNVEAEWEAYAEHYRDQWEEEQRRFWQDERDDREDEDWEAIADTLWERFCEEAQP